MTYEKTALEGALIVTPRVDRVDMTNADAFKEALLEAVGLASTVLVVDMSHLDYISSAGLRSLMIAHKAAKSDQKTLSLAALRPLTTEIFTISRFNLVFTLYGGVREALTALAPDSVAQFDGL